MPPNLSSSQVRLYLYKFQTRLYNYSCSAAFGFVFGQYRHHVKLFRSIFSSSPPPPLHWCNLRASPAVLGAARHRHNLHGFVVGIEASRYASPRGTERNIVEGFVASDQDCLLRRGSDASGTSKPMQHRESEKAVCGTHFCHLAGNKFFYCIIIDAYMDE